MQITGTSGSSSSPSIVDPDKTGFNGLTADDFMRMLIVQLQNQDPMEPVGNDQLLGQLSAMRNLQSNVELSDALKTLTGNQQLSTAAAYIGRSVTGTDTNRQAVTGVVERAFVRDSQVFLAIGTTEVALDSVTSVAA